MLEWSGALGPGCSQCWLSPGDGAGSGLSQPAARPRAAYLLCAHFLIGHVGIVAEHPGNENLNSRLPPDPKILGTPTMMPPVGNPHLTSVTGHSQNRCTKQNYLLLCVLGA